VTVPVPPLNLRPDFLGGLCELEEGEIDRLDHLLLDEEIQVDGAAPERLADDDDGQWRSLARLDQAECLEELIERPVSTREGHEGPRPQHEVELPQGEVAELKAELRCEVGVGRLLEGQGDVQPHRCGPDFVRAAVGRFHPARPSPCRDDEAVVPRAFTTSTNDPPQLTRDLVIPASIGGCACLLELSRILHTGRSCLDLQEALARDLGIEQSSASEDDDRVLDAEIFECELGLQVLDLQANLSKLIPCKQRKVEIGSLVRSARNDSGAKLIEILIIIKNSGHRASPQPAQAGNLLMDLIVEAPHWARSTHRFWPLISRLTSEVGMIPAIGWLRRPDPGGRDLRHRSMGAML
jgi:hypothetical protein